MWHGIELSEGFFYGYLSFLYERVVSEAAWQLRHFTHTSKFLFLLSVSRQQTGIWWAWVMSKYMRDRREAQKPVRAARQKPSSSAFILGGAVLTFRSSPWARISSPGPPSAARTNRHTRAGLPLASFPEITVWVWCWISLACVLLREWGGEYYIGINSVTWNHVTHKQQWHQWE